MSSKRSSSFRRAIANGRRTLQREILLDETGLGLYKRFVRYVAYEILPCETDRRWYFHQNRLCPPPVFIAVVTIVQVRNDIISHLVLTEVGDTLTGQFVRDTWSTSYEGYLIGQLVKWQEVNTCRYVDIVYKT